MSGEDISTLEDIVTTYGFDSVEDFNNLVGQAKMDTLHEREEFRKWQVSDGTKHGLEMLLQIQRG